MKKAIENIMEEYLFLEIKANRHREQKKIVGITLKEIEDQNNHNPEELNISTLTKPPKKEFETFFVNKKILIKANILNIGAIK